MKRTFLSFIIVFLTVPTVFAQDEMETATDAVANMRVGWNLGNTLDSNSGSTTNMWIEQWTSRTPNDYETAWGQPATTRELIHMFKLAGFNAIRVPVTWYPHYGTLNNNGLDWDQSKWTGYTLNAAWMRRVKQIVGYVLDEGMYCILNVHHDTGAESAAWIRADEANYEQYGERFEKLWVAIAKQFKDYDEHLLFEGYNEMLDKHNSWCFASFAAPGNYNAADAKGAYNAINLYAQRFVDAVRSTGGKNTTRNLIVNTYGACDGHGNWNSHLLDPLKNMALPKESVSGHIAFQVHSYWDTNSYSTSMKSEITTLFSNLNTYLIKKNKVPVIMGEWGSSSSELNYNDENQRKKLTDFAKFFVQKAKEKGVTTFYWMGLADRQAISWSELELKDAIIKGYYGEGGYIDAITEVLKDGKEVEIYSIDGKKIGNQNETSPSENLPKGIYIINGKKTLIR